MKIRRFVLFITFAGIAWNYALCQDIGAGSDNKHSFKVKASSSGPVIWNVADNINMWDFSQWHGDMEKENKDHFKTDLPYVKYVQFMTIGGSEQRDMFKNPLDRSVMDDYDFSPLVRACKNVLIQGLIPTVKLGNVPLKFSANPQISSDFRVNKCPPDDYNLWHNYIKALAQTLVDNFGLKVVKDFRFGVLTEYENGSWFSLDDSPEKTKIAYFKLYDYAVDALEQVLGNKVCVGAHSMTVANGLWDEKEFITHCAKGKNYCTGKTGTRICYLAVSFYDLRPGVPDKRTLAETVNELKEAAIKEGLKDLFYGVDEGRILRGGDHKEIGPRAVGHTWQAAYDARLYHTMLDENIDYLSHWSYNTNNIKTGIPSVSAHTSDLFYRLTGAVRLPVEYQTNDTSKDNKTGGIAAFNKKQNKLYLLFYAYTDSVTRRENRDISCEIQGLGKKSYQVKAVRTLISDDTNFFDDWLNDWPELGITKDDFSWSYESFVVSPRFIPQAKIPYYMSCAELKPVTEMLNIDNGRLNIKTNIPDSGVLLYEISL